MDDERIHRVVDGLFEGRDKVSREEVFAAIDRADLDDESSRALHALVREHYTKEQLVNEMRGLGRDVPISQGAILG